MQYLILRNRGLRLALCLMVMAGGFSTLSLNAKTWWCDSVSEIQNALSNANAGDIIKVQPGFYRSSSTSNSAWYYSNRNGSSGNPIIIEGAGQQDGKWPNLEGNSTSSGSVLRIEGSYWIVRNLRIKRGERGLVFDNSYSSKAVNVEVYETGNEGIHIRDNSDYARIENCYVHHTGRENPGYGEGIYVGTAQSNQGTGSGKYNGGDNNCTIVNCQVGPNVTAEMVDVKEGTRYTVIENCTFDARDLSGQHYADSFIDIKGKECVVKGNTFKQSSNSYLKRVVGIYDVSGATNSGNYHHIKNNNFSGSGSMSYLYRSSNTSNTTVCNNKRNGSTVTSYPSGVVNDCTVSWTSKSLIREPGLAVEGLLPTADGADVSIYPNPLRGGELTISLRGSAPGSMVVDVFSIDGRQIISDRRGQERMVLPPGSLPPGLYMVVVQAAEERFQSILVVR